MNSILEFLAESLPTAKELLAFGPLSLLYGILGISVAAGLKRGGWKTGYTRKIFHLFVFCGATIVQLRGGTPAVCVFAVALSAIIFVVLFRGRDHSAFHAIAREKDAPHEIHFVLVPWCATALGGVLANSWFGAAAVVGYAVTGLGDAIAEPVGTRFGKHRYRVLLSARQGTHEPAMRSYEGSAAVFVASTLASAWTLSRLHTWESPSLWAIALGIGLAAAIVEGLSPHGWDNFTLQLVPSALAAWAL
ncbi:MAG: hypothetical protein AAF368_06655 [Planctomycetota bacterium]